MIVIGKLHWLSLMFIDYYAGSYYLHLCPLNTNIPIYLIVFGCISIVHVISTNLQSCLKNVFRRDKNDSGISTIFGCFHCLLIFFLIVWFFIGSYWVFSAWITWTNPICNRSQDITNKDPVALACSCNSVLMYFAFGSQLFMYGLITLFCCCCGLFVGIMCSVLAYSFSSAETSF